MIQFQEDFASSDGNEVRRGVDSQFNLLKLMGLDCSRDGSVVVLKYSAGDEKGTFEWNLSEERNLTFNEFLTRSLALYVSRSLQKLEEFDPAPDGVTFYHRNRYRVSNLSCYGKTDHKYRPTVTFWVVIEAGDNRFNVYDELEFDRWPNPEEVTEQAQKTCRDYELLARFADFLTTQNVNIPSTNRVLIIFDDVEVVAVQNRIEYGRIGFGSCEKLARLLELRQRFEAQAHLKHLDREDEQQNTPFTGITLG